MNALLACKRAKGLRSAPDVLIGSAGDAAQSSYPEFGVPNFEVDRQLDARSDFFGGVKMLGDREKWLRELRERRAGARPVTKKAAVASTVASTPGPVASRSLH